jgi:hypothetical protein
MVVGKLDNMFDDDDDDDDDTLDDGIIVVVVFTCRVYCLYSATA